jgi:DNA helicase HerA-like ATPase
VGDVEKPKMVFFFDEAHLLFNEAPKVLLERIELLVRLIRSKGVGVYFVTQNPLDVPETVLGQLGNRVQHALRAFTPRDQKAVKATAQTMRGNAGLDIEKAITELGVGEALVSLLDAKGRPSETEQVYVLLPGSQLGPITPEQRKALLANSLVAGVYEQTLDRESAYERLKGAAPAGSGAFGQGASVSNSPAGQAAAPSMTEQVLSGLGEALFGSTGPRGGQHQGLAQVMVKSAVRNIGSAVGREIVRGVMGSILGGRKR